MQWLSGVTVGTLLVVAAPANADWVDQQVKRLEPARPYKTRLSAALALRRSGDSRAIDALLYAAKNDNGRSIRRVAILALGKAVRRPMETHRRKNVIAVLRRVRATDPNGSVRNTARKVLRSIKTSRRTRIRRIYVHVQKPTDLTGRAPNGTVSSMRGVLRSALSAQTNVSVDRFPSRAQLAQLEAPGVFLGSSVDLVRVSKKGTSQKEVHCAVSVRANPWQGDGVKQRWKTDQAAQATGKGKVVADYGETNIRNATRQCLLSVTKSVTTQRIIPFLRRVARSEKAAKSARR